MNVQELRIGNYVSKNGIELTVDLGVITKIHNGSIVYKPIPLTEEILLKCGFELNDYLGFNCEQDENNVIYELGSFHVKTNDKETFSLWVEIDGDNWYSFDWCNINSLHELQNLYFALEKEELEINL